MSVIETLESRISDQHREAEQRRDEARQIYRDTARREAAGESLPDDADQLADALATLGKTAVDFARDVATLKEVADWRALPDIVAIQTESAEQLFALYKAGISDLFDLLTAMPGAIIHLAGQASNLPGATGDAINVQRRLAGVWWSWQTIETETNRRLDERKQAMMKIVHLEREVFSTL